MTEQDNIGTVQEAYAAFGRGDVQALLAILSENVAWVTPGPPDVMPVAGSRMGREEVAEFFSTLEATEQVELFEPREYIAQGDKVVALCKYRGRVRATERAVEQDLVHVFTVRDGKIEQFREYYDTAAAVEAYRPLASRATTLT